MKHSYWTIALLGGNLKTVWGKLHFFSSLLLNSTSASFAPQKIRIGIGLQKSYNSGSIPFLTHSKSHQVDDFKMVEALNGAVYANAGFVAQELSIHLYVHTLPLCVYPDSVCVCDLTGGTTAEVMASMDISLCPFIYGSY